MDTFLDTSLRNWRIGDAFDQYDEQWERKHLLGEGAFGEVWKEECHIPRPGGTPLIEVRAVKRINKEQAGFFRASHRELHALSTFSAKKDPRVS